MLGRLDPDHFLGGEMRLDVEAAYRAIKERCADPLGLDVVEAAHGIVEIANTAMVNALRLDFCCSAATIRGTSSSWRSAAPVRSACQPAGGRDSRFRLYWFP